MNEQNDGLDYGQLTRRLQELARKRLPHIVAGGHQVIHDPDMPGYRLENGVAGWDLGATYTEAHQSLLEMKDVTPIMTQVQWDRVPVELQDGSWARIKKVEFYMQFGASGREGYVSYSHEIKEYENIIHAFAHAQIIMREISDALELDDEKIDLRINGRKFIDFWLYSFFNGDPADMASFYTPIYLNRTNWRKRIGRFFQNILGVV